MNTLQSDDLIKTNNDILAVKRKKCKIKDEIEKLKNKYEDLDLTEYLLNLKLISPVIIFTDKNAGKYRYISHPVHLSDLKISLYPLWIQLECTYPEWSNDFLSMNLVNYSDYKTGTGFECLTDAVVEGLKCSYKFARELIINNNLSIPITLILDCNMGSNVLIDFDKGMKISKTECKKHNYHISITTDENMVSNIAKIKYILVVPIDYLRLE
jgi:hypothetical protein